MKKLVVLAAMLAMVLATTAPVALAQESERPPDEAGEKAPKATQEEEQKPPEEPIGENTPEEEPNEPANASPPGPAPGATATLTFELVVEGDPPEDATFFGLTTGLESLMTTPLTDPDGDGLYTGDITVPTTSSGQGGPPGPISLPVRIVQGTAGGGQAPGQPIRVIKDFGTVQIDEDETFSASVSFDEEPAPEEVVATGVIRELGFVCNECARYGITDGASGVNYDLISDTRAPGGGVDLSAYVGERVTVYGILQAIGENVLFVTRVEPASGGGAETITATFELAVEGEPPADATFFALGVFDPRIADRAPVQQLTDPDGDGVYTAAQDTLPGDYQVRIVQGTGTKSCGPFGGVCPGEPTSTIKDFGTVAIEDDETFSASVSFTDGNDGGGFMGGIASGMGSFLPNTGGVTLTLLGAGALLAAGGLLVRRFFR